MGMHLGPAKGMSTPVIALLVLAGAALYFMTSDERRRLAQAVVAALRHAIRTAIHSSESDEPFEEFLRERTAWPIVTPLIVAINALIFMLVLVDRSAPDAAQALINWGGNFAPRTTNGEWWRFVTSVFVHGGILHLIATMAGLVPLGVVLERAVGRVTFAGVYLAAGLLASVVSLWTAPATSVTIGASGAVFGIYGLLLASVTWSLIDRGDVRVPLTIVKRIAVAAAPFFLYNLLTDHLSTASELTGLGAGFLGGLLVARGVSHDKPPVYRAAMVMATAMIVAVAAAVPLRGIIDFRPEIAKIVAVEERTAAAYDAAVEKFRTGRLSAKALVQLIDRTIIPDLEGVRADLSGLRGVPREQQPLVAAAEEYFRLREQSWRVRIEGLQKSRTDVLRRAEQTERAALDAFERMQTDKLSS